MHLESTLGAIVAALTILGLVAGYLKKFRPWWRDLKHDGRAARDAVLGRGGVYDSITGEQIRPPLPGIGQRVASLEETNAQVVVQLTRLADVHTRIDGIDGRVGRLESIELLRAATVTKDDE